MIDSFLYYNETDVFFLRLDYLDAYVDKFVIVETDTTFSLTPHAAQFDQVYKQLPDSIKNKIVYQYLEIDKSQISDTDPAVFKDQSRYVERMMRLTLSNLIHTISTTDYVMISDLDEFWDPRYLDQCKQLVDKHGSMFWAQSIRSAYIDWQMGYGQGLWPGTKSTRLDILPEPINEMYCSKNKTWGKFGDSKLEAGYHFTMMGNINTKKEHIESLREGLGWQHKLNKTSAEIAHGMTSGSYNSVVKKGKMKATKVGVDAIDPELVKLAKQYPDLWSGKIEP
jgi:hypothetical protein